MSDANNTNEASSSAEATNSMPSPPVETPSGSKSSWKLPDGFEDHLEAGLIKAAAGVVVGGIFGTILFRSGKGWRSAAAMSGVGVAVGSTYARITNGSTSSQLVIVPQTATTTTPSSSHSNSNNNIQTFTTSPPITSTEDQPQLGK